MSVVDGGCTVNGHIHHLKVGALVTGAQALEVVGEMLCQLLRCALQEVYSARSEAWLLKIVRSHTNETQEVLYGIEQLMRVIRMHNNRGGFGGAPPACVHSLAAT